MLRTLRDLGALGEVADGGRQASPVYDFSATPIHLDGGAAASGGEPEMFGWVASDFPLMDAIESGLIKVPRVPVDDDAAGEVTRWRNLHQSIGKPQRKLRKRSQRGPDAALPAVLSNALAAQYEDYRAHLQAWQRTRPETTPAMIVVADTIDSAEALYEHIAGYIATDPETGAEVLHPGRFAELSNIVEGRHADGLRTLLVHSDLDEADEITGKARKLLEAQAERLAPRRGRRGRGRGAALEAVREVLNTVGRPGLPGARVRCVISVGMLTEGWDARNVTHIVGYRAFTSRLLCEQVTGRALRRSSYDDHRDDGTGRLSAEYAEVVGVPFEFMPSQPVEPTPPAPPPAITRVHSMEGRSRLRVDWPCVAEYARLPPAGWRLAFDPSKVRPWSLKDPAKATMALMQPHVGDSKIIHRNDRQATAEFRLAADVVKRFSVQLTDRINKASDGGVSGEGVSGEGVSGEGVSGEGVSGEGVSGGGVSGGGVSGGGVSGGGVSGGGVSGGGVSGGGVSGGGVSGGGVSGGGVSGTGPPEVFEDPLVRRSAMFADARAAARRWMDHPRIDCGEPARLLADDEQFRSAGDRLADACAPAPPHSRGGGGRVAVLDHPDIAHTGGVDFTTTLKHIHETQKSELSHAACHSQLEMRIARALDSHPAVDAWARNFQLGWSVPYYHDGAWRRYEPDFVARLDSGVNLIIEGKGRPDDKHRAAAATVTDHWIPCVAGTTSLPEELRRWSYLVIQPGDDPTHAITEHIRTIPARLLLEDITVTRLTLTAARDHTSAV